MTKAIYKKIQVEDKNIDQENLLQQNDKQGNLQDKDPQKYLQVNDKQEDLQDKDLQMQEKLSYLIMAAGEIMLKNGGEIFRVEETMQLISKAYGASADVYALSNGIFLTIDINGRKSTYVKEVPISSMNLSCVVKVNTLSKNIEAGKYNIDQALQELYKIECLPQVDRRTSIIFAGFAGFAFSYIFGGTLYDSLAAFIAGAILYSFALFANKRNFPKFLRIVIGSGIATLMSNILFKLGLGDNLDHIIIGAIITMVPGVALTTSIHDFINEDYLSGTISLVEVLIVVVCISVGVLTMLNLSEMIF